ncbi:hypothetical protein H5T87_11045 [bacterium]|nr:hypothetical protein [bacterium]
MKKVWLFVGSILLLLMLLSSCGGGGGGVAPISPSDVPRLFPLNQGLTQTYETSGTEYSYIKATGVMGQLSRERLRFGPFSLTFVLPKFPHPLRQITQTYYEWISDQSETGTNTQTIIGTHKGDPFPPQITTTVQENHGEGSWIETYIEKVDGQVVKKETYSGGWEYWDRSFYTNESGEVLWWGEQEKNEKWEPITVFDPPLVMLKAGATSWKVGHVVQEIEDATFSADIVANLVGQETVTVPAGTFTCYKVVYKFTNVKLETPPSDVEVLSWNMNMSMTVWLALDKGLVKSVETTTLTASFKKPESGATGSITHTSTYTDTLKSTTTP